jgi:hypothetical protein
LGPGWTCGSHAANPEHLAPFACMNKPSSLNAVSLPYTAMLQKPMDSLPLHLCPTIPSCQPLAMLRLILLLFHSSAKPRQLTGWLVSDTYVILSIQRLTFSKSHSLYIYFNPNLITKLTHKHSLDTAAVRSPYHPRQGGMISALTAVC